VRLAGHCRVRKNQLQVERRMGVGLMAPEDGRAESPGTAPAAVAGVVEAAGLPAVALPAASNRTSPGFQAPRFRSILVHLLYSHEFSDRTATST
jgi:hypothetical protein